jgi:hypothetical protein
MIKKAIIFSFIFAFFCSIIAPDFANAMGSSTISDEAGLVILGVGIVLIGVWYLYSLEDSDTEESYNQKELIKEAVEKNISPSGEFAILRW